MRTNLLFRSSAFLPLAREAEQVKSGRHGKRLADLIAAGLPEHGFEMAEVASEVWGWRVELRNDAFPLWIGCENYDVLQEGFLCFIEPSRPYVLRWLKRIPTSQKVEALATALERVLRDSGKVRNLRWWPEAETRLTPAMDRKRK